MKHFLKETDFVAHELPELFALAQSLKQDRGRKSNPALAGQTWAMIFSKSSTRTRVSFEVGIHELGGNQIFLNKNDIQLGRDAKMTVTLINPIAMSENLKFAIREGGRTVGAGVVTKVIE